MKKSKILKIVKEKIQTTHREYGICFILNDKSFYLSSEETRIKCMQLRNWVSNLVGDGNYYEDWIKEKHKKFYKKLNPLNHYYIPRRTFLQGRLQWIDWMIKIHEEHGD